mgnify:CR=1 FL=1
MRIHEGEARDVGKDHAKLALQMERQTKPTIVLSGGETTVTVKGDGRGGRNAEYLLGLTIALDGAKGIHALACDTDGIDGSEDNAGALFLADTLPPQYTAKIPTIKITAITFWKALALRLR